MSIERTLSIIKPDATRRNLTGEINAMFERAGLRIVAQRRLKLTREQAELFYRVHKDRAFFNDLCSKTILLDKSLLTICLNRHRCKKQSLKIY